MKSHLLAIPDYLRGIHDWPMATRVSDRRLHVVSSFRSTLESQMALAGAQDLSYVVRKGDTLSAIVLRQLRAQGERATNAKISEGVAQLARDNDISNPDRIYPGQKLNLSALGAPDAGTELRLASATPPPEPPEPATPAANQVPVRSRFDTTLPFSAARQVSYDLIPPGLGGYRAAGGPVQISGLMRAPRLNPPAEPPKTVDLNELIDDMLQPKAAPSMDPESPWSRMLDAPARLSSEFGMRQDPFTGRPEFHPGIDLAAPPGTQILAYRPGVVTQSGWAAGYGRLVTIEHEDGTESLYAHCAKSLVQPGTRVEAGTPIALVGTTGRSTGPHLHFEIRKNGDAVDPVPFLAEESTQVARKP